jgi:PPOX class probable F420-dependent enzyme
MSAVIPENFLDLVTRPVIALVATVSADGVPSVSPIWVEWVDGRVRFSSQDATLKRRNAAEHPAIAFCLVDPDNPYRYLELRGEVEEMTDEGAHEHLDALTVRYMGKPQFPGHDYAVPRSLVSVRVDRVVTHG